MAVYDYDLDFEFHRSCIRIAKKEHRCIECGGLIVPGDRYYYEVAGIPDGRVTIWQVKICQSCQLDWKILENAYNGDGRVEGIRCQLLIPELSTLRQSIWQAREEEVLIDEVEQEMFLRWFSSESIHPDEAWRLLELPFPIDSL